MTNIKIDPSKPVTYKRRLGWVNVEERVNAEGKHNEGIIIPWISKGGVPVMVPDQWADWNPELDCFEELPLGAPHKKIGSDVERAMFPDQFEQE